MYSYYVTKMLRIIIFYIAIQTATGALTKRQRYDQFLSNIHDVFVREYNDKTVNRRADDSNELNSVNYINISSKEDDRQDVEEILSDIANTLDKIKAELLEFNEDSIVSYIIPIQNTEIRRKRQISNDTLTEETTPNNNITEVDVTTTDIAVTITEEPVIVAVENETVIPKPVLRENNETESNLSGRRMMPGYVATTSRVKDKLLSYLEDTFNEVERKLKPLTNIKIALSNDDHYRIGYIIATIDTLEVNLKKLKNDMNLHQHNWDDEKILDLFDRIKATNSVTSSLIESLKKYLPKS